MNRGAMAFFFVLVSAAGAHIWASDPVTDRPDALPGFSAGAASMQRQTETVLFDLLDNELCGLIDCRLHLRWPSQGCI